MHSALCCQFVVSHFKFPFCLTLCRRGLYVNANVCRMDGMAKSFHAYMQTQFCSFFPHIIK